MTSLSWERTWAASGWAKTVRTAAATMCAEALGTLARTLRMKDAGRPLPGRAHEDRGDGLLEPEVVVADDQLHAAQAPRPQVLEERRPRTPCPQCRPC